jgi:hypothetical protein
MWHVAMRDFLEKLVKIFLAFIELEVSVQYTKNSYYWTLF